MSDGVIWAVSGIFGVAGVGAELCLFCVFLSQWRHARAERRLPRRQRALPAAPCECVERSAARRALVVAGLSITGLGGVAAAQEQFAQPAQPSSPPVVGAQSESESASKPDEGPVAGTAPASSVGSAISVQLNLDYTTAYFYRGIIQEDSGLILQPAARVTANLFASEDQQFKLDGFVGTWNSFHGQKTAADSRGDFTEYWYESDLYAGLTATAGKIAFTMSYTFLTSPSDAYETVQELGFTLALDDSERLKKWALKPYALVAIETGADASDGADSDSGVYLELGVAPGFSFDVAKTPVTISFPASVGLSLSNYYQDATGEDDTFGFAQVGVKASIPLGEPGRLGTWTLNAGVSVLFLGDQTSDYNAGEDVEVIGSVGVQWNF